MKSDPRAWDDEVAKAEPTEHHREYARLILQRNEPADVEEILDRCRASGSARLARAIKDARRGAMS